MRNPSADKQATRSDAIRHVLRDIFGFTSFRPNQESIVEAILNHRDCFVVMPTGGGKSLCYQLPAHILDGTCVVVSPLISLMKDQVDAAIAIGLRAAYLNSSLTAEGRRDVEARLRAGELDLIYVSPERFAMPNFVMALRKANPSFVAIDEAHCISEWGHDFRPDYLNLATIVKTLPNVPVAAFTATATHRVQADIVAKLNLRDPEMIRASFNRPNLYYKVEPKDKVSDQILRFVRAHAGEPGIIYRTTRKQVEQTAEMLIKNGVKALPYHAGLDEHERSSNQDAFNRDAIDVIVATIAFGMGIDKSNVRYVLHGDLPKTMESYYQETGRSGRDGEPAHCLLLFGYGDVPKIRYFIDQVMDFEEREHGLKGLREMIQFATVHACRRRRLLNYFGEDYAAPENGSEGRVDGTFPCCDICEGEVEGIDATRDAQIVMSAIARTGERFGINHIIGVIRGEKSERVQELGHDTLKTFGVGADQDKRHWRVVIDNLLAKGLISQSDGDYPVLQLSAESRTVLFDGSPVKILKTKRRSSSGSRQRRSGAVGAYDEVLFEQLRELRKSIATEKHVPPYVVFSDKTLHEMCRVYPVTPAALSGITGIGEVKLTAYGEAFGAAIQSYLDANPQIAEQRASL